jgi:hypothetical protein
MRSVMLFMALKIMDCLKEAKVHIVATVTIRVTAVMEILR